jgi:hypothetical protein
METNDQPVLSERLALEFGGQAWSCPQEMEAAKSGMHRHGEVDHCRDDAGAFLRIWNDPLAVWFRGAPATVEMAPTCPKENETNATKCTHRDGDGRATADDSQHTAGDECPVCGCTLGSDGYWYLDAEQAPSPGAKVHVWDRLSFYRPLFLCPTCVVSRFGDGGTPTIGMTQEDVDTIRRAGGTCACCDCGAEPQSEVASWA